MTDTHLIKTDTVRELNIERAKLIERLSQAYRLLGPAALYVRWYGEDGGIGHDGEPVRKAASDLGIEMQQFFDAGLFGDKEEASK